MQLTRGGFFAGAVAALAAPALADSPIVIPTTYDGGRFFAIPRVASTGSLMKLWLDTDGSGFIFDDAVGRFGLETSPDPTGASRRWTRLPAFSRAASIPPPLGRDGQLVVFERDADTRADPILQGFDGQLGASWFQGRVWSFDYRLRRVLLRQRIDANDGRLWPALFRNDASGMRFDGGQYPRIDVRIADERMQMSFDVAASVFVKPAVMSRIDPGLPAVRATSFVRSSILGRWRAEHWDWETLDDISTQPGVAAIRVPSVRLGSMDLGAVWFTTRPGDDVFEGDSQIAGKLGAPAFFGRVVSIDYPNAVVAVSGN